MQVGFRHPDKATKKNRKRDIPNNLGVPLWSKAVKIFFVVIIVKNVIDNTDILTFPVVTSEGVILFVDNPSVWKLVNIVNLLNSGAYSTLNIVVFFGFHDNSPLSLSPFSSFSFFNLCIILPGDQSQCVFIFCFKACIPR